MSATTPHSPSLGRRGFILGSSALAAGLALPACTTGGPGLVAPEPEPDYATIYGAVTDGGYQLPAIPYGRLEPRLLRRLVDDPTGEPPGTIVVDTSTHHLYAVQPGGKAMRYGVGLGKSGFGWAGEAEVEWKKAWPTWTPPPEMIARRPDLARYSAENGGMPPGPENPLGARALYLFRGGRDTMYRLHGTPEWSSIGTNASSGCVRLINQDVMDLYARVTGKVPVKVRAGVAAPTAARPTATAATTEPIDAGVPRDAVRLE